MAEVCQGRFQADNAEGAVGCVESAGARGAESKRKTGARGAKSNRSTGARGAEELW